MEINKTFLLLQIIESFGVLFSALRYLNIFRSFAAGAMAANLVDQNIPIGFVLNFNANLPGFLFFNQEKNFVITT